MARRTIFCLYLLLFLASCAKPVVRGIVIDQEGTPVKRASVAYYSGGNVVKTDKAGRWRMRKLPFKNGNVVVYSTAAGRVTITGDRFRVFKRGFRTVEVQQDSTNRKFITQMNKIVK